MEEKSPLREAYDKIQDMRDRERETLLTMDTTESEAISYQKGVVRTMDDILALLYPMVSQNQ